MKMLKMIDSVFSAPAVNIANTCLFIPSLFVMSTLVEKTRWYYDQTEQV